MPGRPAFTDLDYEDAELLLARGMSVAEAAKRLGMSRATLYRLIARHRNTRSN